jgi:hypothetical protein
MWARIAGLFAMIASSSVVADPSLLGTWRSDRSRTMHFIEKNVVLEKRTFEFLKAMMGRLELTFSETTIRSALPDWDTTIEGKAHHLVGFDETHPYRVLATHPSVIAVETTAPVTGKTEVVVYNFESPDVMWIYTGGSNKALPESHLREYFTRSR